MRPVPRQRHGLAAAIFIAVAISFGAQAFFDDKLSASQANIASVALKRHDATLFGHDPTFGPDELWRFHTPALQSLLEMVLVPTGYSDPALPFRLLTGLVVLVLLWGMYVLLYNQCRSWSVSAFVAVLSCRIIWTLGWSYWGAGSLDSITPATMYLAAAPLLVLSYLRYQNQWRVLLVFFAVGLLGNLHLVTAMNLTLVLLFVYIASRRFRPASWPMTLAAAGCALLGALPLTSYYIGIRTKLASTPTGDVSGLIARCLDAARLGVLYPDLLEPVLRWGPWAGVLAIPAVLVLMGIERFRLRHRPEWVCFLIGCVLVAFGLQGASQLVGSLTDKGPPIFEFANAASLILIPLYVFMAQGLTNLFRLVRSQALRRAMRWGLAVLMAAWLIPSDNLRYVRHRVYFAGTAFMDEAQKPRNIRRHLEQRRRRAELQAIAAWARENTDKEAVFLSNSVDFRMRARRSIVVSCDDVKYVLYLSPQHLADWLERLRRLQELLYCSAKSVDAAAVRQFATQLRGREPFTGSRDWYVILPAYLSITDANLLQAVAAKGWGEYYNVYRIR